MCPRKRKPDGESLPTKKTKKDKSTERARVTESPEPIDPALDFEESIESPEEDNEDNLDEIDAAHALGQLRQDDLNRHQSGIPLENLYNTVSRVGWQALQGERDFQVERLNNIRRIDWAAIGRRLQQDEDRQHHEVPGPAPNPGAMFPSQSVLNPFNTSRSRTNDFYAVTTSQAAPSPFNNVQNRMNDSYAVATSQAVLNPLNSGLTRPVHPPFLEPANRGYIGAQSPFGAPASVFNAAPYNAPPNQNPQAAHVPDVFSTRLPPLFPFQADPATLASWNNLPADRGRPGVQGATASGYAEPGPSTYNSRFTRAPTQADTDAALEAYNESYLQDLQPYQGEEDLIMCICLRPDDGMPYIECSNGDKCMKRWYHLNCLGFTTQTAPGPGTAWYCPDCQRQKIGGAGDYLSMMARDARMRGRPRQVWQPAGPQQNAPTVPRDNNPSGTFQNFHVWNLRAPDDDHRALIDLFDRPDHSKAIGIGGTPLKKPNKNSWLPFEEQALETCVKEVAARGFVGQPLWEAVLPKLHAMGVDRCMGAVRNRYMRGLREKTGIDERRKPNPSKMTTAQQVNERDRDPGSRRKRGGVQARTGRYSVSRAWGVPAKTPPPVRAKTPEAPRRRRVRAGVHVRAGREDEDEGERESEAEGGENLKEE